MDAELFKATVAPLFKSLGFKKSGATWRKDLGEAIAVFNVQKSQWGSDYYLNVGLYFNTLRLYKNPRSEDEGGILLVFQSFPILQSFNTARFERAIFIHAHRVFREKSFSTAST